MRKAAVAAMATGLFVLSALGSANANPITVNFFVEIDSIDGIPDGTTWDYFPSDARVGDTLSGSVTYDDASIPDVGSYTIGLPWWGDDPTADEMQEWTMTWSGLTESGFMVDLYETRPQLRFTDGGLSGIYAGWQADLQPGLEAETFLGTDILALGSFYPDSESPLADFSIHGTAYFPVPDPASSLMLLGISLAGIGCCGRWLCQHGNHD